MSRPARLAVRAPTSEGSLRVASQVKTSMAPDQAGRVEAPSGKPCGGSGLGCRADADGGVAHMVHSQLNRIVVNHQDRSGGTKKALELGRVQILHDGAGITHRLVAVGEDAESQRGLGRFAEDWGPGWPGRLDHSTMATWRAVAGKGSRGVVGRQQAWRGGAPGALRCLCNGQNVGRSLVPATKAAMRSSSRAISSVSRRLRRSISIPPT